MKKFREDLERLINSYSIENNSDTPDFILSSYLIDCLNAFDRAVNRRSDWYKNPGDDTINEIETWT